ncbi:MAG: di-trans,poly-cis-decaprenylcistransferase [Betaproteobacteria bacterium]|nr:di-trans,poly-cis-decaprenylcistransferase [Betaproteobacteria bacterium]
MHSSTQVIPDTGVIPRHVAVIMDGNGRWAKSRNLPRVAGHKKGVDSVRMLVRSCAKRGIQHLTLFAFSSENWRRPPDEVSWLMALFVSLLEHEIKALHRNKVRLRVIGDLSAFEPRLQQLIASAESMTAANQGLKLTIAANYGGRWDILQAMRSMLASKPQLAQQPALIGEADFSAFLTMADAPEPDLFIRTGGEQRVSNFLLWHLAYTELYFTETLWPDFDEEAFDQALESYRRRERRFGRTSEQIRVES